MSRTDIGELEWLQAREDARCILRAAVEMSKPRRGFQTPTRGEAVSICISELQCIRTLIEKEASE